MKKQNIRSARTGGFGSSLEQYLVERVSSAPWRWEWIGVGMVGVIVMVSIASGYVTSPTLEGNILTMMREAALRGDYVLADKLYQMNSEDRTMNNVLGVSLELEELVYPKRRLMREIKKQEELLVQYLGSRDILLTLASLYNQAGNCEKSDEYYEMARVLDPNGDEVNFFSF